MNWLNSIWRIACIVVTFSAVVFIQSVEAEQGLIDSLYQKAQSFLKAGEFENAIENYTRIIDLDTAQVNAYWFRSYLYGQLEKYDLAIGDLRKVNEMAPDFPAAYGSLGWYLILQGNFEEAREPAQKAHQLEPDSIAWAVNLGHISLLTGDSLTAKEYYLKSMELLISEIQFQQGPVADFELFISKGWKVEQCRKCLGWMKHQFENNYRYYAEVNKNLKKARNLMDEAEYLDAAQLFEKSAQIEKGSSKPRLELLGDILHKAGFCYEQIGNFNTALSCYEAKLAISRQLNKQIDIGGDLNLIGKLYGEWGNYDLAIEHLEKALAIFTDLNNDEELAVVLNNLGSVYRDRDQYDRALNYYQQAITIARKLQKETYIATLLNNIAEVLNTRGQYNQALDYYEQALSIDKKFGLEADIATDLNNIGLVYESLGQYEDALRHLEQALAIDRKLGKEASSATVLNNIGLVYQALGDYDKAIEYHEEALTIDRKSGREADISTDLNNLGLLYGSRGQFTQAIRNFEQALAMDKESGREGNVATVLNNLGTAYESLSQYGKAIHCFEEALDINRKLGRESEIATNLNNLGLVYNSQGQFEKALEYFDQVLAINRKLGRQVDIAIALTNKGRVYHSWGRYEKAIDFYQNSLKIANELGIQGDVSSIQTNIAGVYVSWGQYDKALQKYEQSLVINQELQNELGVGFAINNIGNVYYLWGQFDYALEKFSQAKEIFQRLGIEGHVASTLRNIGLVYDSQGNFDTAIKYYEQALVIDKRLDREYDVAIDLISIGDVYESLQQYKLAIEKYKQALAINRKWRSYEWMAINLNNIGLIYYRWKQYEQAAQYYSKALAINKKLNREYYLANNLHNIGLLYLAQKKYPQAIKELSVSVDLLEKIRKTAVGDVRRDYLATEITTYQKLTSAFILNCDLRQAFRTSELSRARLLSERLAGGDSSIIIPSLDAIQKELPEETAILVYTNVGLNDKVLLAISRNRVKGLEIPDSIFTSVIFNRYERDINELGPYSSATEKISIRKEPVGLHYGSIKFEKLVKYYYYIIRESTLGDIRGVVPIEISGKTPRRKAANDLSHRLYTFLINPFTEILEGKNNLIIMGDDILNFIPFETLIDNNGRYLAESFNISYTPSISILTHLKKRQFDDYRKPMLAIGGAIYDSTGAALISGIENDRQLNFLQRKVDESFVRESPMIYAYDSLGLKRMQNLPGTLSEVEGIKSIIRGAETVTGQEATEYRIKALSKGGVLANYKVIHFATHGLAIPEIPELSCLILSQIPEYQNSEDGFLNVREIAGLKLNADFVNLSACETGLGKLYAGEGVVGLTQSFLIAGANSISVSLWQVADASTATFMVEMYKLVNVGGLNYSAAITEMKRRFIRGDFGEKYKTPFYWAPFVYYGL